MLASSKRKNKFILKSAFILVALLISAVFLFVGNFALAQDQSDNMLWGGQQEQIRQSTGLGNVNIQIAIARIIRVLLGFLGIVAVVIIMYAGFLWMTSNGDEAKIDKAKKTLVSAVIGLIIILSAFAIAQYVLNKLYEATGGAGGGGTNATGSNSIGFSALGNCTLETVYPEPDQKEVPRNTSIIITFREPIDTGTVQIGGSVLIHPQATPSVNLQSGDATVSFSADRLTMVILPNSYLGSPTEYVQYEVRLTNDILKQGVTGVNAGMFSTCRADYYQWSFEVSNKVDLDPPQVLFTNGAVPSPAVFPGPDNQRDTYSSSVAVVATGLVTVISQPNIYVPAAFTGFAAGVIGPASTVTIDPNCRENGQLNISIQIAGSGFAALLVRNSDSVSLGSVPISNAENSVTFPGYLTISLGGTDTFQSGYYWPVNVTAERTADTLTVGEFVYSFVSNAFPTPNENQIRIGADINNTAANIANAISSHMGSNISATAVNNVVNISAIVGGTAGNNIELLTNAAGRLNAGSLGHLSGGVDSGQNVTVRDKQDKPRNAVIQVNFNEAINPITVSGRATDTANTIRVVNIDTGGRLNGKFVISNLYRTVEFVSDNLCGVNGCGEEIYCLPENSHLRVELSAANLAECVAASDCASRSPYDTCVTHCQNSANNQFYPLSRLAPLQGIMDAAMNSLDGDRSGDAEGPTASDYNENSRSGDGDNYQWSFFINDTIDMGAPVISRTEPVNNPGIGVSTEDPVIIEFTKMMMSSSLKSGSVNIISGANSTVSHRLVNLISLSTNPAGYFITSSNVDDTTYGTPSTPPDGEADWTRAYIIHSRLVDSTSYRSQTGSGVKDIYQNCFKPSSGPACTANQANPTCCSGAAPQASPTCP